VETALCLVCRCLIRLGYIGFGELYIEAGAERSARQARGPSARLGKPGGRALLLGRVSYHILGFGWYTNIEA
jgi:hypothetical protein